MKDLSDYKEKATLGKEACRKGIRALTDTIKACEVLGIDDVEELKKKREELFDRLAAIDSAEAKIDAKCN